MSADMYQEPTDTVASDEALINSRPPRPRRYLQWELEPTDLPLPVGLTIAAYAHFAVTAPFYCRYVYDPLQFVLVAGMLALLALPLSMLVWGAVVIVRRTLQLRLSGRIGVHVGSWTALLLCCASALANRWHPLTTPETLLALLLGPLLATPIYQYAGAWCHVARGTKSPPTKPRFALVQLMIFTTWAALAATLLRLLYSVHPILLLLFCGWFVFQWISLTIVMRLFHQGAMTSRSVSQS